MANKESDGVSLDRVATTSGLYERLLQSFGSPEPLVLVLLALLMFLSLITGHQLGLW
ncbi:hypothetical protein [Natrinema versiforme]|uniref:hypothetical protein n=1 Tax=Natrinema versiforme TaxID=88724 RepID=UPI0015861EBC|nr:hypothetical protein [Natrinema versiforme]